jgi:hypothetical protein
MKTRSKSSLRSLRFFAASAFMVERTNLLRQRVQRTAEIAEKKSSPGEPTQPDSY